MSELFHVLNRGVDKRIIFTDDRDRARFVHDMWEFNDSRQVENIRRRVANSPMTDFVSPSLKERTVDIHGWCLMGNHYHLLLSEVSEGGMTNFIRRLNIGYSKYFNERHKRCGTLFQGRTKKILIDTDAHFLHILNYIHLNPLDMMPQEKNWRAHKVRDAGACLAHLKQYRWSSYQDYCGIKNFPSVLTTDLFGEVFGNYTKKIRSYLQDMDTGALKRYDLE